MASERHTQPSDDPVLSWIKIVGTFIVDAFHYLALLAIAAAVIWSAVAEFVKMVTSGQLNIEDILLLFIYLELGAMVGIYFKTHHLPVRFLLYVAITALTRMLIGIIKTDHHDPGLSVIYVSAAILLLALATLAIRFGSFNYPTRESESQRGATGKAPD